MKFPLLSATLKLLKPFHSNETKPSPDSDFEFSLYDKIDEIVTIANYDNQSLEIVVKFYELTEIQQQLTLVTLVEHNMIETIEVILKSDFDINFLIRGQTPLHYAIQNKNADLTKLLIHHEANIEYKDVYKETALNCAVRTANIEIIQILLDQGAKVNTQASDSTTPLEFAIHNGDAVSVDLLKQYGAHLGSAYLVKNV